MFLSFCAEVFAVRKSSELLWEGYGNPNLGRVSFHLISFNSHPGHCSSSTSGSVPVMICSWSHGLQPSFAEFQIQSLELVQDFRVWI